MRQDRRKPTIFTNEKAELTTEKNEMYAFSQPNVNQMTTKCQPNDDQMSAQNKINKSKVNKNKDILSTDVDAHPRFDYQSVIDCFNSVCKSLPKVQKLTDNCYNFKKVVRFVRFGYDIIKLEKITTKVLLSVFLL